MEQYKLIKKYPSLPQDWEEGMIIESGVVLKHFTPSSKKYTQKAIFFSEVIDYPEYWKKVIDKNPLKLEVGKTYKLQYKHCKSPIRTCKITRFTTNGYPWMECSDYYGIVSPDCYNLIEKVVAKDYEILSFKQNISSEVVKVKPHDIALNEEAFIKNGAWVIYSVKRLSDGEVFTIDDFVECTKDPENFNGKIRKFTSNDGTILVHYYGFDYLKHIQKVKRQPLFTTEDGVDIYERDEYWYVIKSNFKIIHVKHAIKDPKVDCCVDFSSLEKAEEYILQHAPSLSLNDVNNTLDIVQGKFAYGARIELLEKLVALIKSQR